MKPKLLQNLGGLMTWGLLASTLWAQSAQMDGRRLDNSLQQGSGAVNAPIQQPDFRLRNSIITGNVAGLGYFHGNVGYRAPGEFQGRLSSDSLFRFQAQSLPPTGVNPLGFGNPALHSVPSLSIQQSPVSPLYSSLAPTSVADLMAGNRLTTGNMISSGLTVRAPVGAYGSATGIDTLRSTPVDRLGVSFQSVQDGRLLDMTASPLLGVRRVEAGDLRRALVSPLVSSTASNPAGNLPPQGVLENNVLTAPSRASLGESARVQPGQMQATPGAWATHEALRDRGQWAPSLALGATIAARLESPRVDDQVSLDKQVERLQAQLFSPLGTTQTQPGQDVYLDILSQVRENTLVAKGQPSDKPGGPGQTGAAAGLPMTQSSPSTTSPARDAASAWMPRDNDANAPVGVGAYPAATQAADPMAGYDLALQQRALRGQLTKEQLEIAKLERDTAMALARGLRLPTPAPTTQTNENDANALSALRGVIPADEPVVLPESLQALITSLQKPGPALTSLAGTRSDLLNDLMRSAEADLAAGRYFDAEGRYRAVLDLDPAHPLARVGQVHAQMAAGMVYSATLNLRRWLEDHPELMGVSYQANLLPPAGRLEFIREQLDEMIRTGRRLEPPLLLAYLGYQFDLPQVTRYALDVAQARAPLDPLLPLLRQVWLPGAVTQP